MVGVWGNIVGLIGSILAVLVDVTLYGAFFLGKRCKSTCVLIIGVAIIVSYAFSLFAERHCGYTLKMLFEVAFCYVLCALLYQSRWDRRLFVIVTCYAVLYSITYWADTLCMSFLHLTYEEYVWNIPLYSSMFLLRAFVLLAISLVIRKYRPPISVSKQARAWVPLSVVFPLSTLLIIWQIYTFPNEQEIWQICLLILDVVDVVALLLLDHLEQSASNREQLAATADRAHMQAEIMPAISQDYPTPATMTQYYPTQHYTL